MRCGAALGWAAALAALLLHSPRRAAAADPTGEAFGLFPEVEKEQDSRNGVVACMASVAAQLRSGGGECGGGAPAVGWCQTHVNVPLPGARVAVVTVPNVTATVAAMAGQLCHDHHGTDQGVDAEMKAWTQFRWCDTRAAARRGPAAACAPDAPPRVALFAMPMFVQGAAMPLPMDSVGVPLAVVEDFPESLAGVLDIFRSTFPDDVAERVHLAPQVDALARHLAKGAALGSTLGSACGPGDPLSSRCAAAEARYARLESMYVEYAADLVAVRREADAHRRRLARSALEDMEAEITYLRLRRLQPRRVLEVGALCGYSSFWILAALRDNWRAETAQRTASHLSGVSKGLEMPELHSFDLVKCSHRTELLPAELRSMRRFFLGDVFTSLADGLGATSYDYVFLDAEHTASFARRYIPLLEERSGRGGRIVGSVHDVYGLDEHDARGVSEEGAVVVDWLAQMEPGQARLAYTVSSLRDLRLHIQVMQLREQLGIAHGGIIDALHACSYGLCEVNSMLFFDVGGGSGVQGGEAVYV